MTPYPRPAWTLTVDGKDITADITGRLNSLTLTDNRGFEADQLDIELDDSDGRLDLPPRGAVIKLALAMVDETAQGLVDKGSYTVDEIEHSGAPDTLTIRARSADLRAGLTTQRERSWHATTLGAIVRELADENGLTAVIPDTLAGQAIDHLDQTNESAANLLTRLAQQFDAIATVKEDRLLFVHMGLGLSASGQPIPAIVIERQSGDSHRFSLADRHNYTQVRATWHDIDRAEKGEIIWGQAQEDEALKRGTPAASPTPMTSKPYKKLTGKPAKSRAVAQRKAKAAWKKLGAAERKKYAGVEVAYDDRNLKAKGVVGYGTADEEKSRRLAAQRAARDAEAARARSGDTPQVAIESGADNIKTIRHVYASRENAKRAARAEWRRLQRGVAAFSITLATGRPDLMPETPAIVKGFKTAIDSTDWIIVKVTHTVSDGGYTTALELEIKATEIE